MTLPRCRSLLFLIARSRQTRRHPQIRSFSSLPRAEYGATLSFRHSHSFADTPDTENVTREHPIDIIEGETAIRKFRQHVEDGNYPDARSILMDFVQNHELGGNLGLFRELRDIITTSNNADIKLVTDLGESLARKGHMRFVRDEIRPLFESDSALSLFDRALAKIQESARPSPCAPSVFEEPTADYVLPASAPLPPSIADLVWANLPEILPQSSENDMFLFEDSSVEYPVAKMLNGEDAPQRNSRVLEQLITNNSFDQAFAMLQEMENLGSSIAPSSAFGGPAERALREGKSDEFLAWLAHVPPHREGNMTPHFQRIQQLLFQQTTLDHPLLTKVIILLAGKEYRPIVLRCLQAVVRDTKSLPELGPLLRKIELEASRYYLTENPSLAPERRQRYARFLLSVAVRVCSWEGRFSHALALLPGDRDHDLFLTPPTYQILLKELKQAHQYQWISKVQRCGARDLARLKAFHGDEYLPFPDPTAPNAILPPTNIDDIAGYIRFFHDAIAHEPTAMHPHTIANFITSYLRQGHLLPGALYDLTERAVRTSHGAMYAWTLGEMQYYRRQKEGRLIIQTFVDHFLLDGVPKEEVMKIYAQVADTNSTLSFSPPVRRVTGYDAGQMYRAKSWMGTEHRALVWEVLINRAQTQKGVWDLYRCMQGTLSQDRAQRAASASYKQIETMPLLGPEVFMMFLKHIGHGSGVVDTLLRDMLRMDVQPTSAVYGHVLFVWARTGHRPRVLNMLRAIHDQFGERSSPDSWQARQRTEVERGDYRAMLRRPVKYWNFRRLELPAPDVPLYVHAIRGFIERNDLEGAVATARALARLMGIESLRTAHTLRKAPGNEQLDYWLDKLEDLTRKQDQEAGKGIAESESPTERS
ncbi:hypothetical protein D9619_007842 [Psilocybe cf. subviscida]|uniref:Uncharacterized protein n=1 Tax=Psilocybe cf. subviscida TaxID=2480587 RepID=A0A8H5ASZ6_9AGAR|nr:hypothetical protein D9619_007842 [Psilocybe cf. subviscida]